LAWAAQETGRRLEYADAATEADAASTILHGSSASLTPAQAIAAILPTTDLIASYNNERLLIAKK